MNPKKSNTAIILLLTLVFASTDIRSDAARVEPGGLELEGHKGLPALPGDVVEPEPTEGIESQSTREFIIAPLPSRNPLMGWTLAVPALWLYRPDFSQPEDSVWVTGGAAFYAENKSVGGGLFHKMSLGGDQWRFAAAAFTADLRYDYFGIGGSPDRALPLRQEMDLLVGSALYNLGRNVFVGLQAAAAQTQTRLDIKPGALPPGFEPPDLSLDIDIVTLAPKLSFDTRDNEFYPRDGWLVEGTLAISRSELGSDVAYEKHEWAINRYAGVTGKGTLAMRVATQYVGGDAPFFLYPAFGTGSDLRGYQTGTYRDRFLFAAQAEWRQRLSERWGAVAFAGVGTVASDLASWGETLPSAGVGIRWVVAPKNNLSVRVDFAWGRGDNEFYVSIGEAF